MIYSNFLSMLEAARREYDEYIMDYEPAMIALDKAIAEAKNMVAERETPDDPTNPALAINQSDYYNPAVLRSIDEHIKSQK